MHRKNTRRWRKLLSVSGIIVAITGGTSLPMANATTGVPTPDGIYGRPYESGSIQTQYIDFQSDVNGLETADFYFTGTATGCTLGSVPALLAFSFSLRVSNCSDGTFALNLKANSVTYPSGISGPATDFHGDPTEINRTKPTANFQNIPASADVGRLSFEVASNHLLQPNAPYNVAVSGTGCQLAGSVINNFGMTFYVEGCSEGSEVQLTVNPDTLMDVYGNLGPATSVTSSVILINPTAPAAAPTASATPADTPTPVPTVSPTTTVTPTPTPTASPTPTDAPTATPETMPTTPPTAAPVEQPAPVAPPNPESPPMPPTPEPVPTLDPTPEPNPTPKSEPSDPPATAVVASPPIDPPIDPPAPPVNAEMEPISAPMSDVSPPMETEEPELKMEPYVSVSLAVTPSSKAIQLRNTPIYPKLVEPVAEEITQPPDSPSTVITPAVEPEMPSRFDWQPIGYLAIAIGGAAAAVGGGLLLQRVARVRRLSLS